MSKPDGKNTKLLDELAKAIGLLGTKAEHGDKNDGQLLVTWFLAPLAESRKLYLENRRVHLLQAVTGLVGDEDRRGREPTDDKSPWWYHLSSKKPAGGSEAKHVPIDVIVADSGVPAVGVGARYAQDRVDSDDASKRKPGVLVWLRAWLLGVRDAAVPLVQPLDAAMRPQLEGEAKLSLPSGFLSSAALAGAVRLPGDGKATGVDVTVRLAGWKPAAMGVPRQPATATDFVLRLGDGATGDPHDALETGARLALFLARAFIEHQAKDGNLAQRVVEHLIPLFGADTGPIKPFPLFANAFGTDAASKQGLLRGNSHALAQWCQQFNPVKKPPFDWNLDAPAVALAHVWGLVRKNDKVEDHRDKALAPGSLTAWLVGDDDDGGFGLHLDGDLEVGNKFWLSAGLVARKKLLEQGNVRARLDVALAIGRVDFAGWAPGQPWPPPAPTLRGPALELSLALEPVNDGTPLVALAVPGTTATISRGKLTVRWQPGQAPELSWRFVTSVSVTATPQALAAHAIAQLTAALPPDVVALLTAARDFAGDIAALLARLRAVTPTFTGTIAGIPFALGGSKLGEPPSLTLTAGGALSASLALAGGAVTCAARARLPLPVPDDRLSVALDVATTADRLDLGLVLGAGTDVTRVPLRVPTTAEVEAYALTLLKQLVVPTAVTALLDADVLGQELTAGVTVGDALGWAKVVARAPGASAGWALAQVKDLVSRELLQVVADLAAGLAQLRKAGVDVGDLHLQPAITTAGTATSYGVTVGPVAATPPVTPPPPLTLLDVDGVKAGLASLSLTGLSVDGGKVTLAPALTATGVFLEAGGKDAPLLATDLASLESVRVAADLTVGGKAGVALDKVGVDLGKLRLALGNDGGGLASSLLGKGSKDNPGFSLGFDRTPTGVAIRLSGPRPLYIDLDAQLGPLTLQRFGLDVRKATPKDPREGSAPVDHLYLLLDGGFALGPIAASASGLGVYFLPKHLVSPDQWRFTLDGLGLSLDAGPVSLSGFLQRHEDAAGEEFRGAALIKLSDFQIGAVGAYRQVAGKPSMFVFGALNAPLGGPPFFFVTGVAGGFGVNRDLVIPDDPAQLEQLVFFQVMEGDQSSLANVGKMGELLAAALPARQGSSWFAAGVKFTSFSLIRGKAVLYVRFGSGFELGVAASAQFKVPEIAEVNLVLKGAFTGGDDPRLTVRADLVKSWLLSPDCRLTGSFFFGLWPRRGDCLLTIGGFHKDYVPPAHYPTGLSRLGFSWAIGSTIKAEGQVYFALTPREAMAGARLSVAGSWGPLAAGFDAWFDAWIGWDPFWFDLEIGVRIWVKVFGIRASLGVALRIWGPEVGGTATIEVAIWSFTIPFGKARTISSKPLAVGLFVSKHLELALPASQHGLAGNLVVPVLSAGGGAPGKAPAEGSRGLFTVEVGRGARAASSKAAAETQATVADGSVDRPFRVGPEFQLDLRSRVPVTTAVLDSRPALSATGGFGFAPCAKAALASKLEVKHHGVERSPIGVALLEPTPMPMALFGDRVAKAGDGGAPTRPLTMGLRLDGWARLGPSAGVVRATLELARPEEIIALPAAWTTPAPIEISPDRAELAPVPTAASSASAPPATLVVRVLEAAPLAPAPATTADAPALPILDVAAPRARGPAVVDVVLRDLRPEARPVEASALRLGSGGDALVADNAALTAAGVSLAAGETLILHDVVAGARLVVRGDQAVEVVWLGGFGALVADQVLIEGERVAPDGAQRALVRGLGQTSDLGDLPTGFTPRTVALRLGDRAYWLPGCVLGLVDGEPLAERPTLVAARSLTREARAVRLAFAPPAAVDRPSEPGAWLAVVVAAVEPGALDRVGVGTWTRREAELEAPHVRATDDGATLIWRVADDGPCTLTGELGDGLRLVAAVRLPVTAEAAVQALIGEGRLPALERPAPTGGASRIVVRAPVETPDREVVHG